MTTENLNSAGFKGFAHLYLRPMDSKGAVGDYKAATRAQIEKDGYRILVNVGDQASALIGGHAEQSFQMPNPFYFIQ